MNADQIHALFVAELTPDGFEVAGGGPHGPVAYLGTVRRDGCEWSLAAMPHYTEDLVRLMARNVKTAFARGLIPKAA